MVDDTTLRMLMNSTAEEWNRWRAESYYKEIDLSGRRLAVLRGVNPTTGCADFRQFHFIGANLDGCTFDRADLTGAMFGGTPERPTVYRNVVISRSVLRDSSLLFSRWEHCKFLACDLSHAGLQSAAFPDSDLTSSNLTDAKLVFTDFSGANLTNVRFDGCDLGGVNLLDANLTCASLTDASLIHDTWFTDEIREFVESEFGWSQFEFLKWHQETYEKTPIEEHTDRRSLKFRATRSVFESRRTWDLGSIQSVDEYLNLIRHDMALRDQTPGEQPVKYYYRGEPGRYKRLRPSLFRTDLADFESEMLYDLNSSNPGSFQGVTSAFEQLVIARHHGLPTRILDITKDPLVALYFACQEPDDGGEYPLDHDGRVHLFVVRPSMIKPFDSDAISAVASFATLRNFEQRVLITSCPSKKPWDLNSIDIPHDTHMLPDYPSVLRRLLHIIGKDNPRFSNWIDPADLFSIFVVEPRWSFPRLRAQQGAFLISAFHEDFGASEVSDKSPPVPLYRHGAIRVPDRVKGSILAELDRIRVNGETLFPGLDSAARGVARRFTALRDARDESAGE